MRRRRSLGTSAWPQALVSAAVYANYPSHEQSFHQRRRRRRDGLCGRRSRRFGRCAELYHTGRTAAVAGRIPPLAAAGAAESRRDRRLGGRQRRSLGKRRLHLWQAPAAGDRSADALSLEAHRKRRSRRSRQAKGQGAGSISALRSVMRIATARKRPSESSASTRPARSAAKFLGFRLSPKPCSRPRRAMRSRCARRRASTGWKSQKSLIEAIDTKAAGRSRPRILLIGEKGQG